MRQTDRLADGQTQVAYLYCFLQRLLFAVFAENKKKQTLEIKQNDWDKNLEPMAWLCSMYDSRLTTEKCLVRLLVLTTRKISGNCCTKVTKENKQ